MRHLGTMTFGQYAPDQPNLNNPGIELAFDVLPRTRGYDSLPMLQPYGTSGLSERCVGAWSAKDMATDTSYIYAGTTAALYALIDAGWVDVSRVVPYQAATRWDFASFGNLVIAASLGDQVQSISLGDANYVDLTASNVQASSVATIRGFVVVGDVDDDDGYSPWRVRWGPLDDPQGDWAPSPTTLADFNDLRAAGGRVQRVIGGEFGMIFRERSTWRMTFVGSPAVWQFDEVDPGIGTIARGSVVQHGARTFFFSDDGIRMTVGDASRAVGEERVDRTFLSDLDGSFLDRVTGAVYTDEQIIVWAYPGVGNTGGQPNRLLIYNYAIDQWATGDEAVEILFRASTPFRSIDGFDDNATYGGTQTPAIYAAVDDIPGSLDDGVWAGGVFQLGAIDASRDLSFYTGPPRDALFQTGEVQHIPGRRAYINEMRSLASSAGDVVVTVSHRSSQRDALVTEPPVSPTAEGFIPVRVDDRYMRYQVLVSNGFIDTLGLEVYGERSGGR